MKGTLLLVSCCMVLSMHAMQSNELGMHRYFDTTQSAQGYAQSIIKDSAKYAVFLQHKHQSIECAQRTNVLPRETSAWWNDLHAEILRQYYFMKGSYLVGVESDQAMPRFTLTELIMHQRFERKAYEAEGQMRLDLSRLHLSKVETDILDVPGIKEVTHLSLCDNRLSFHEIAIDVFYAMPNLKHLDLSSNNLDQKSIEYIASLLPGVQVNG